MTWPPAQFGGPAQRFEPWRRGTATVVLRSPPLVGLAGVAFASAKGVGRGAGAPVRDAATVGVGIDPGSRVGPGEGAAVVCGERFGGWSAVGTGIGTMKAPAGGSGIRGTGTVDAGPGPKLIPR